MRRAYVRLIKRRTRKLTSKIFFLFLSCISVIYYFLHSIRYSLYKIGILVRYRPPCKVISVGNITCGGTGKTPMVHYLAKYFAKQNFNVAILSRGYGKVDDENMEIEFSNVRRFVAKNRKRLAKEVVNSFTPDVIILDDGFQHYQIERDLDIVLIDALDPWSDNHLLPAGLLREPRKALSRADMLIVTHSDNVAGNVLTKLLADLSLFMKPIITCGHKPASVYIPENKRETGVEALRNNQCLAFCGIGNPESFKKSLESAGVRIAKFISYPDHHVYSADDISSINSQAKEFMVDFIITTQKDSIKIKASDFDTRLYELRITLRIIQGQKVLENKLQELMKTDTSTVKVG